MKVFFKCTFPTEFYLGYEIELVIKTVYLGLGFFTVGVTWFDKVKVCNYCGCAKEKHLSIGCCGCGNCQIKF